MTFGRLKNNEMTILIKIKLHLDNCSLSFDDFCILLELLQLVTQLQKNHPVLSRNNCINESSDIWVKENQGKKET